MTLEVLLALVTFGFVTSVTPGPNNLMLLSSGLNFGFRRSLPHMLGIGCGFVVMIIAVGLGLGALFTAYPLAHTVLLWVGVAYLLYLAWRIANAGPVEQKAGTARPMTFLEAALFQWVNPKAWVMAVSAATTYVRPATAFSDVLIVGLVFGLINIPSISLWAGFGTAMQRLLTDAGSVRIFNIVMAVLLVLSVLPMVLMGK